MFLEQEVSIVQTESVARVRHLGPESRVGEALTWRRPGRLVNAGAAKELPQLTRSQCPDVATENPFSRHRRMIQCVSPQSHRVTIEREKNPKARSSQALRKSAGAGEEVDSRRLMTLISPTDLLTRDMSSRSS